MITVKALLVSDNGELPVEIALISNNLDGMKEAIGGGWIEGIGGRGWGGYCDEEGKNKGMEVNIRATRIAQLLGWTVGDVLCGPVVFLGPANKDGEDTDVTILVVETATALEYI